MTPKIIFLATCASLAFAVSAFADGKDYHDQDLKSHDFTQQSLNDANFADAILTNSNFTSASLKRAIFKGANVEGVRFVEVDLTEADLRELQGQSLWIYAHFDKANMEGITISSSASNCIFKGTHLKGAKLAGYFYGCNFSGADLRGANLRALTQPAGSNRWKGAIYDDDTAWPDGFDPKAEGAVVAAPVAAAAPAAAPDAAAK